MGGGTNIYGFRLVPISFIFQHPIVLKKAPLTIRKVPQKSCILILMKLDVILLASWVWILLVLEFESVHLQQRLSSIYRG